MLPSCRSVELHQNGGHKRQRGRESALGTSPNVSLPMIYFILLAVVSFDVVVLAGDSNGRPKQKIRNHNRDLLINGDPVQLSEHQFFVRSWPDNSYLTSDVLCGASLIHSDMILTAAHCQGAFNYGAMAYNPSSGKMDRFETVDLQIAYPDYYESDSINYDIMVMRLSSPINDIQPVVINYDPDFPIRRNEKMEEASTSFAVLEGLGLGITETGKVADGLEIGLFSALTNDQCYDRLGSNTNAIVAEDLLCADPSSDESICLGDSGGPLTARVEVEISGSDGVDTPWGDSFVMNVPVQVGVISFGNDCQSDYIPDGFTRVSFFANWITTQICKYSNDPPPECSDYFESMDYLTFQAEQDPRGDILPGRARMTLDFQHDFLAEETVFVIRDKKGAVEYVGPQYVPKRGERVSSNFFLDAPGKYTLEIIDYGGDGLNNPDYINPNYTPGSWSISAEYSHGGRLESIATGDSQFEFSHTIDFELPDASEIPAGRIEKTTIAPTAAPTEGTTQNIILSSSSFSSVPKTIHSALNIFGLVLFFCFL
mmetsp:Transcript_12230/g.34963  ORF Transcript_12230/g.34963 Transcript_12230/m.34963 type:complete len:541 (-) Transcript_12230:1237-2859(-)